MASSSISTSTSSRGAPGVEVHGPPDHWVADTDWKICAENFAGDGYHTPVAHQLGFNLGYFPSSGSTHSQGWAVSIPGRGHGIGLGHSPNFPPFGGFPDELVEDMQAVAPAGAGRGLLARRGPRSARSSRTCRS